MKALASAVVLASLPVAVGLGTPQVQASTSWFTKSEDFSRVTEVGLNFASDVANEKSGWVALENASKNELVEPLLKEFGDAILDGAGTAAIDFKNSALDLYDTLNKINEIAEKLGAGENVDALMVGMDILVGKLNNPLASALWASVKLTYESHKLVQDLQNQIEIEQLYGIVNRDRRMMGESANENAPPLIARNTETIDYFYEKYLIVNPGIRALVKTYVEVSLGETFIELPSSSSFWTGLHAYLSGENNDWDQIEYLENHRNVARGWINELIADLNKQVEYDWEKTRMRRLQSEWAAFYGEFASLYPTLDDALEAFRIQKEIEAELHTYPARVEHLEALLQAARDDYDELDEHDDESNGENNGEVDEHNIAARAALRNGPVHSVMNQAERYARRSRSVLAYDLFDQFTAVRTAAIAFSREIGEYIEQHAPAAATYYEEFENPITNADDLHRDWAEWVRDQGKLHWGEYLNECYDEVYYFSFPPLQAPLHQIESDIVAYNIESAKSRRTAWRAAVNEALEPFNLSMDTLRPDQNSVRLDGDEEWSTASSLKPEVGDEAFVTIAQQHRSEDDEWSEEDFKAWVEAELNTYRHSVIDEHWAAQRQAAEAACTIRFLEINLHESRTKIDNMIAYSSAIQSSFEILANDMANALVELRNDLLGIQAFTEQLEQAETHRANNAHFGAHFFDVVEDASLDQIGIVEMGQQAQNIGILRGHIDNLLTGGAAIGLEVGARALDRVPEIQAIWDASGEDLVELADGLNLTWHGSMARITGQYLAELFQEVSELADEGSGALNSLQTRRDNYIRNARTDIGNRQETLIFAEEISAQWEAWYAEQTVENENMRPGGYYESLAVSEDMFLAEFNQHVRVNSTTGLREVLSDYAVLTGSADFHGLGRFATANELSGSARAAQARQSLSGMPVRSVLQNQMPRAWSIVDHQTNLRQFEAAPEANLIYAYGHVWKSDVESAAEIVSSLDPLSDDVFQNQVLELEELVPGTVNTGDSGGLLFNGFMARPELEGHELGRQINALHANLAELTYDWNRWNWLQGNHDPGTLLVTVTGTGTGMVWSDPSGLTCSSGWMGSTTCSYQFPSEVETVSLTAMAEEGSSFVGWSDLSGACSGTEDCTIELDVVRDMIVEFQGDSGNGDCGPGIDETIEEGPAPGDIVTVEGRRTISVEAGVTVPPTSELHLEAYERIVFRPGVRVAAGGRLTARVIGSAGALAAAHCFPLDESSMVSMQASVGMESGADRGSGDGADGGVLTGSVTTAGSGAWASWDESSDAEWQEAGLAAPQGLTAVPGDQSVILRWDTVPGADGYHIFWSRTPGIHPFTAASHDGFRANRCNGPVAVGELENDTEYFFIVTANRGSEESGASAEVAATPEAGPMVVAGRYQLEAFDAPTVVDLDTGLEWQRCALGQTWEGTTCVGDASRVTWAEAALAVEAVNQGTGDRPWQIPGLAQLQGLVFCSSGIPADFPNDQETGCWGSHGIPTLEPTVFPASTVTSGWFWSATPEADGRAWGVDFDRGTAHAYQQSAFSGVRLMRPADDGV